MNGRIIALYERHAEAWAAQRGDHFREPYEASWLDRFTTGLARSAHVLDLGSGSGRPIGTELLRRGLRLTGVDSSPTLTRLAAKALPAAEWITADMRTFDPGRQYDAVLAWHSFFHLSPKDQEAMFPRFKALTTPGGRLMFTAGPRRGVAMGAWGGEPLYHASLEPSEYVALLDGNGFDAACHRVEDATGDHATIWLASRRLS